MLTFSAKKKQTLAAINLSFIAIETVQVSHTYKKADQT